MFRRRTFIAGTGALALSGTIGPRAWAQTGDARVALALSEHANFATGFRVKIRTGMYGGVGKVSLVHGMRIFSALQASLAELSETIPTFLLVHQIDTGGTLNAWLLGGEGIIAEGQSAGLYSGLADLQVELGVHARTATRAPRKRSDPEPPPIEDRSTPDSRHAALAGAAATLLPGNVAMALAARAGRLLLLPSRDTGTAPYAALPMGESELLSMRYAMVVLPDIETAMSESRSWDPSRLRFDRVFLAANPDLSGDPVYRWGPIPATWEETQAVASIFGRPESSILSGLRANHDAVVRAIDGYQEADIIYLASHGVANSVNPMDGSFIALAGRHLFGRDLLGSRFEAWAAHHPLVVLSACQTGLGKTFQGGTFGIARGWYAAGAAQVVASLWNVDDSATAFLMSSFADKVSLGRPPEAAMRWAQLEAAKQYPGDPGAWASFTVYGAPARYN